MLDLLIWALAQYRCDLRTPANAMLGVSYSMRASSDASSSCRVWLKNRARLDSQLRGSVLLDISSLSPCN